jgi:hypothetical protein
MNISGERMVQVEGVSRSSAFPFISPIAVRRALLKGATHFPFCASHLKGGKMATKKRSSSKKKSSGRKYGKAAGKSVKSAMHRKKKGTLKSGKGGKGGTVKSRKQAIAIGLSEAREKGAKVPKKK